MAKCASLCAAIGYDEININCGCPSPRVKEGSFGAVLMLSPHVVVQNVIAMTKTVTTPVTIKCRLGVDDHDSYEELTKFIGAVGGAGVKHFIIHARKAFLGGLNPKENRTVPPLKYDWVYKLAADFPDMKFSLNGGLQTIESIKEVLAPEKKLLGCMIGRLSYNDPWVVGRIDKEVYGCPKLDYSRKDILLKYAEYVEKEQASSKVTNSVLIKPISFLFSGEKESCKYRQFLGDGAKDEKYEKNARKLIEDALELYSGINLAAVMKTHSQLAVLLLHNFICKISSTH
eukprot:TRINITY_DN15796_c0_g1_i1.p1 TRINITY_DN15796_c0_g1~~TRINITY_DN15796_c0_g1_i1.p1  ORF type:complete len:287 (+),score=53.77 TRINITY_DN15796_c0_g1_i1:351-1211(+)